MKNRIKLTVILLACLLLLCSCNKSPVNFYKSIGKSQRATQQIEVTSGGVVVATETLEYDFVRMQMTCTRTTLNDSSAEQLYTTTVHTQKIEGVVNVDFDDCNFVNLQKSKTLAIFELSAEDFCKAFGVEAQMQGNASVTMTANKKKQLTKIVVQYLSQNDNAVTITTEFSY